MKYIWILAFSVVHFAIYAQPTVPQSVEPEARQASKVLVVPFHQTRYYFSDCDKNIAAESKLKMPEVRHSFRYGFDYATESRLEKEYRPLNLVQMEDSLDKAYMGTFYQNVTYTFDTPTRLVNKSEKKLLGRVKSKIMQIGQKEEVEEVEEVEAYTQLTAKDDRYMALQWQENGYLEELVATYEPHFIITINQFEIKTDYQRCIDRDLGNYTRRLKVHYNVFDRTGNRIAGDVVTAKYNSTTDDIHRIIQDNFGSLADYIMASLPEN